MLLISLPKNKFIKLIKNSFKAYFFTNNLISIAIKLKLIITYINKSDTRKTKFPNVDVLLELFNYKKRDNVD